MQLPAPITQVGWELAPHDRYRIELAVNHTTAGLNALEQNYRVGASIIADGRQLIITSVDRTLNPSEHGVASLRVFVEAMDPAVLLNLAATGSTKIEVDKQGKREAAVPKKPFTGTRRLITSGG